MAGRKEKRRWPWTPGPWFVWKGHLVVMAGEPEIHTSSTVMGHRCHVAEVTEDERPQGEARANARLISFAPPLYEALEGLVAEVEHGDPPVEHHPADCLSEPCALCRARTVLRLARGAR